MIRRYELIDKYNDILSPSFIEKLLWFQDVIGYRIGHLRFVRFLIVLAEDLLTNKGLRLSKFSRVLHWATGNSIFYIDHVNGLDANAGTSWGTAWKTITNGATLARIAAGDIIRIAKSPAPTSLGINATWTNLSRTVTLASSLTATIYACEAAWTASANVTCTTSAINKEGTNSSSIAIASGFTTGKVAYRDLGSSIDFSAYQQVSFWIRSSVAIPAGRLTLRLCSDTVGDTVVNTINIPAVGSGNAFQVVTVDTAAALGSSIRSISISASSDPGTVTILIDNIIACKASSAADSLTLSSLISKNSSEQGGSEGWYGIQSINGTTVILESDNVEAGTGRGYSGATETVTTYKRETTKTTPASGASFVEAISDSGTVGNDIQFQGGYDTGTGNQTGETILDGQNSIGYGIYAGSKSYVTLNRINVCRYSYGIYIATSNNFTIDNVSANNNYNYGIVIDGSNNTINTVLNANNNFSGIYFNGGYNNKIISVVNVNNNSDYGILFSSGSTGNIISEILSAKNNTTSGIGFLSGSSNNKIKNATISSNGSSGITNTAGKNYIYSSVNSNSTEVSGYAPFSDSCLFCEKYNGTAYSKIFTDGGNIVSEASTLSNGSGTQWKLTTETNTNRQSNYPLSLPIAKIAVTANNLVTVSAWFKKGHATNIGARLVCKGGQIAGVPSDVITTKANDTNEEQLTITFTPTEAGVVEIEAQAFYVAGHSNVIVDALTISQA